MLKCKDCGHEVVEIQYTKAEDGTDKELIPASNHPKYKHKLPHPACPCKHFNLKEDEVE